jgi:hypothetical protein
VRNDYARTQLQRLWEEHLRADIPLSEWYGLEDRFGRADSRPEVAQADVDGQLLLAWGGPELPLYDTYLAGYATSILKGRSPDGLNAAKPDARLTRYVDVCEAEASAEDRAIVEKCRRYVEQLDRVLDVAQRARQA